MFRCRLDDLPWTYELQVGRICQLAQDPSIVGSTSRQRRMALQCVVYKVICLNVVQAVGMLLLRTYPRRKVGSSPWAEAFCGRSRQSTKTMPNNPQVTRIRMSNRDVAEDQPNSRHNLAICSLSFHYASSTQSISFLSSPQLDSALHIYSCKLSVSLPWVTLLAVPSYPTLLVFSPPQLIIEPPPPNFKTPAIQSTPKIYYIAVLDVLIHSYPTSQPIPPC